jgi:predicted GNAT family acetyltransferase
MTIGADGLPEEHTHGPGEKIAVRDNARAGRYEAVRGGEVVGIMIYERTRRRIELIHTVTDPEHRGEGVASVLVRTVLAEARAAALPVLVICPFLESWLQRHPEQTDIVIAED